MATPQRIQDAIGRVTADGKFLVRGLEGQTIIEENISDLKEAWQRPLRW